MEPIDPIPDREITPFAAWQAGLLSPREAATAIADELITVIDPQVRAIAQVKAAQE